MQYQIIDGYYMHYISYFIHSDSSLVPIGQKDIPIQLIIYDLLKMTNGINFCYALSLKGD